MLILNNILTVLFAIDSIALAAIILIQQGKDQGLGAIAGSMPTTETYWGKNKGRSKEEKMKKITRVLAVIFFVLAVLLNMNLG